MGRIGRLQILVMKALIEGEEVHIDNHYTNLRFDWDSEQDIHIHKTTHMEYDGKQISVDARISINSDRGVVIVAKHERTQKQELIRKKIIAEIKNAFENPRNRKVAKAFVKDLIDELNSIDENQFPEIAEQTFDRIMGYFNLSEKVGKMMRNEKEDFLRRYRDSMKEYYIRTDENGISIGEMDRNREKLLKKLGFNI